MLQDQANPLVLRERYDRDFNAPVQLATGGRVIRSNRVLLPASDRHQSFAGHAARGQIRGHAGCTAFGQRLIVTVAPGAVGMTGDFDQGLSNSFSTRATESRIS